MSDPDTVIVDNSGDPEAFRREDTNDTSLSDYQLFHFSSIDLIVKSLILSCNANHDERLRNQYNIVLQNIYDHVSTWRAFQYRKGARLSNGTLGSECASDLLEELQVQRAFSRLSRHLAIAMIKQNNMMDGIRNLALSNTPFQDALRLLKQSATSYKTHVSLYLIWLWQFDRIELILEFHKMLQQKTNKVGDLILDKFRNKTHELNFAKHFLECIILSPSTRQTKNSPSTFTIVQDLDLLSELEQNEDTRILAAIHYMIVRSNTEGRDVNFKYRDIITLKAIKNMFKAFQNDIAGSSIVPFLLYLAARKYDWRLTLFGEILFSRFTQFAITILKDILQHYRFSR